MSVLFWKTKTTNTLTPEDVSLRGDGLPFFLFLIDEAKLSDGSILLCLSLSWSIKVFVRLLSRRKRKAGRRVNKTTFERSKN